MNQGNLSRRGFLERSIRLLTLGAGLPAWYALEILADEQEKVAAARRPIGPNDQIVMGAIGVGGRGLAIMRAALKQNGVRFVAVCDVDGQRRANAARVAGNGCRAYRDFRELLARDDLDAVTIGTVDHWHALTSIAAMKSGRDVYCEKPLSLTVEEGQVMVRAARQYGRIVQTGSQQRSNARYRLACELVRNGRIGKVHTVEARIGENPSEGPFPVVPVPPELDWDFWQGPTPDVPYLKQRCHSLFRWWSEYSGGKNTDWGAHHNDIAQWALGTDDSGPVAVTAVGERPSDAPNSYNCHPHFAISFVYPNGTRLVTTSEGENGNRFIGDRGWIFVSRGRIEASDPKLLDEPLQVDAERLEISNNHMANFLDGVRTRNRPICDAGVGHRSASVCHIGVISLRLGKPLRWDPPTERFHGPSSDEANRMLSREMRSPWKLDA